MKNNNAYITSSKPITPQSPDIMDIDSSEPIGGSLSLAAQQTVAPAPTFIYITPPQSPEIPNLQSTPYTGASFSLAQETAAPAPNFIYITPPRTPVTTNNNYLDITSIEDDDQDTSDNFISITTTGVSVLNLIDISPIGGGRPWPLSPNAIALDEDSLLDIPPLDLPPPAISINNGTANHFYHFHESDEESKEDIPTNSSERTSNSDDRNSNFSDLSIHDNKATSNSSVEYFGEYEDY